MSNEGRILEGNELILYSELISNLEPIEVNHGTHCSDYHYETLDELSNSVYIIELTCGGGAELTLLTTVEYKEYLKPWSQKFEELKQAAERNKPVVVQDYLTWTPPVKGLKGILDKIHDSKDGAERILSERRRQVTKEGWTVEGDDKYKNDQLVDAAMQYIGGDIIACWPTDWKQEWYKPTTRIRDLEKAGALIAAEIDRLLRIQKQRDGKENILPSR